MNAPLPAHLRALAEHERVVAPDYEWVKFIGRNGDRVPESNLEERFGKWLKTAKKKPTEAEASAPKGSTAPTPHAVWQEPKEWREAREADPDHELGAAESAKILAMLNGMGGAPVKAEPEAPRELIDPLCLCGRIMSHGSTTCGMCPIERKP